MFDRTDLNLPASIWTPEKTDLFVRLWAAGECSASEIASALGPEFTRHGVLGKRYRMQLPERKTTHHSRPDDVKHAEWARNRNAAKRAKRLAANPDKPPRQRINRPPLPIYELPPEPELTLNEQPCSLMELTSDTCRWPVGDVGVPGFYFCGAEPRVGQPYCAHHHKIAYTRPPPGGPRRPWVEWRRG